MASAVEANLVYYNKWRDVKQHKCELLYSGLISGVPPALLVPSDAPNTTEWVVPCVNSTNPKLEPRDLSQWFSAIETIVGCRPKRVTAAIVASDGTVVYYFVFDGIMVPTQD